MGAEIAIIGDYNSGYRPHIATNDAIGHATTRLGLTVHYSWVATSQLASIDRREKLIKYQGLLIAPGSPYKSMEGVLGAIRIAREHRIPLLGTCGGFQHMILEYARNVLGYSDAEHEETSPGSSRLFISRLACSLAGRSMSITLVPDSSAARIYGRRDIQEQYYCNFGVNPDFVSSLRSGTLRIVGSDEEGEVRVVELPGHPFFIGTLFVPQASSTAAKPHPLISGFVKAASQKR